MFTGNNDLGSRCLEVPFYRERRMEGWESNVLARCTSMDSLAAEDMSIATMVYSFLPFNNLFKNGVDK